MPYAVARPIMTSRSPRGRSERQRVARKWRSSKSNSSNEGDRVMHIKPVDRMQKYDRLYDRFGVRSMARDTAQTKRAVDGILDLVHAAADEIERSRRLPDAVVAALRDTGINRLLIPAALGGMEAPITDVMDVMERIAAVDGSAGWCAAIGAGSNVFAGRMPATSAGTVFADPDQSNATMFAPVGRMV